MSVQIFHLFIAFSILSQFFGNFFEILQLHSLLCKSSSIRSQYSQLLEVWNVRYVCFC